MTPTIGRIVHYKSVEGYVKPAMIVDVSEGAIYLTVFEIGATFQSVVTSMAHMAEGPRQAGTDQWWWPERI